MEVSRFFGGRSVRPLCHLRHERKYHSSLDDRSVRPLCHLRHEGKYHVSLDDRSVRPLCHLRHEGKYHVSLDDRSVRPLCHLRHERKYHVSLVVGAFVRSVISVMNGSITFLWQSERSSALSCPSRTEVSRFFGRSGRSSAFCSSKRTEVWQIVGRSEQAFTLLSQEWTELSRVSAQSPVEYTSALHWRHRRKFHGFLTSRCMCPRSRMRKWRKLRDACHGRFACVCPVRACVRVFNSVPNGSFCV